MESWSAIREHDFSISRGMESNRMRTPNDEKWISINFMVIFYASYSFLLWIIRKWHLHRSSIVILRLQIVSFMTVTDVARFLTRFLVNTFCGNLNNISSFKIHFPAQPRKKLLAGCACMSVYALICIHEFHQFPFCALNNSGTDNGWQAEREMAT